MQGRYNVLFLCTGNSARSIMAEAIMKRKGLPNFIAYSAGSHPAGFVHPEAVKQLEAARLPTEGLRSKSWEEFAQPVLHTWISSSQFVTTPLKRFVPFGLGSP